MHVISLLFCCQPFNSIAPAWCEASPVKAIQKTGQHLLIALAHLAASACGLVHQVMRVSEYLRKTQGIGKVVVTDKEQGGNHCYR